MQNMQDLMCQSVFFQCAEEFILVKDFHKRPWFVSKGHFMVLSKLLKKGLDKGQSFVEKKSD